MESNWPELKPGDIFAVKGEGILAWLNQKLIKPETDRYHFGIIGDYVSWEDDYIILESIDKGIAVGRISFYKNSDVKVYRINNSDENADYYGRHATTELSRLGRRKYDYLLCLKIALGVFKLWLVQVATLHRPTSVNFWEIEYATNSAFICTEAAATAYERAGYLLLNPRECQVPSAYQEQIDNGRLVEVASWSPGLALSSVMPVKPVTCTHFTSIKETA